MLARARRQLRRRRGNEHAQLRRRNGRISILAYFPDNAIRDSTPTCIATGPDGALYVGTLALLDSIVLGPSAIVYRVDPSAANPNDFNTVLSLAQPWATGLYPINGCAFGSDGTFYASQLFTRWPPPFAEGDVGENSVRDARFPYLPDRRRADGARGRRDRTRRGGLRVQFRCVRGAHRRPGRAADQPLTGRLRAEKGEVRSLSLLTSSCHRRDLDGGWDRRGASITAVRTSPTPGVMRASCVSRIGSPRWPSLRSS